MTCYNCAYKRGHSGGCPTGRKLVDELSLKRYQRSAFGVSGLSKKDKAAIGNLYRRGCTLKQLADAFGCSTSTVWRLVCDA